MLPGRLLPSSESPCRDLPAGISCVANHPGCKPLSPQVAWIPTSRRRDPCVGGRLSGRMALGTFAPLDVNTKTALRAFDHRAGAYRWCGAFSTRAPSALVSFGVIRQDHHRACMHSNPSAWSASRSQGGAGASDGSRGRASHRAAYAISSRPGAAEASPHPESPTAGI